MIEKKEPEAPKKHTPKRVSIHCTDTPNNCEVSIKAITADHVQRGFGGIGYHVVIQPNGHTEWVKPLNRVGAHVAKANTGNIGIALAGKDKFAYAQFRSLRLALDAIRQSYPDIRPWMIYCHSEYASAKAQGKTCPNMDQQQLLGWYCGHNDDAIEDYLIENDRRYTLV